jgi:predicted Zn-dependent protease
MDRLLPISRDRAGRRWHFGANLAGLTFILGLLAAGCFEAPQGTGPGHRQQTLALNAAEELELGREAYREILSHATVVTGGPEVDTVRRVSARIAKAAQIEPLQREINLRLSPDEFEWEYNVLRDRRINAFCLPGGKIGVFTGLLELVENDDQLAVVIAHEVAHALAHHASERLSLHRSGTRWLADRSFDREQELEADHIGVFLMTFAGYDPEQAVAFWREMQAIRGNEFRIPEILSDHPNDERRMKQLQSWTTPARSAKRALDEGRIAPPDK